MRLPLTQVWRHPGLRGHVEDKPRPAPAPAPEVGHLQRVAEVGPAVGSLGPVNVALQAVVASTVLHSGDPHTSYLRTHQVVPWPSTRKNPFSFCIDLKEHEKRIATVPGCLSAPVHAPMVEAMLHTNKDPPCQ